MLYSGSIMVWGVATKIGQLRGVHRALFAGWGTTRNRCEIPLIKFTVKTPERRHWRRFVIFIVNFEHKRRFV